MSGVWQESDQLLPGFFSELLFLDLGRSFHHIYSFSFALDCESGMI